MFLPCSRSRNSNTLDNSYHNLEKEYKEEYHKVKGTVTPEKNGR